jgi:glycosyltransferase involved in cell wall biosynthesis
MSTPLTVVMPVYNEAQHLRETIDALVEATERSGFGTELVLVDDGSSDGSAEVAREAARERLPLTVLEQPNGGRFAARRAGLESAKGEWVLLLDGRVRLDPGALAFVHDRLWENARVWNGHVEVEADGNPYGTFWKLIAELAWSDYFAAPRETSFGTEEFDRYPKGTTCLLAPRVLLLDATRAFRSRYEDLRSANDDTPLLRWIAERDRIHLSPLFACRYLPRATLGAFLRHSVHRGVVFVDGHGRRESRFFAGFVAFYPVSAAVALRSLRKPSFALEVALAISGAAAALGVARRRSTFEIASLALLAPAYAAAHALGMWRGLVMIMRQSAARESPPRDGVRS